jgi:hypothetical protein
MELCEYLHPLIAAGDILEVYVQHIKYMVDFFKIGFYQNIFIKRRVGDSSGKEEHKCTLTDVCDIL